MNRQFTCIWMLFVCGCHYPIPKGFVQVDAYDDTRFRAVSAEGSALSLRTETNPKNGDSVFWEKIIRSRLVDIRGYQLADRREVRNHSTSGIEMIYSYKRQNDEFTYLITFFTKGGQVHLFEAAGTKAQMIEDLPKIQAAIQTWPL